MNNLLLLALVWPRSFSAVHPRSDVMLIQEQRAEFGRSQDGRKKASLWRTNVHQDLS